MSSETTVGYRYLMGIHFGISYGEVDELVEIRGGDRIAWSGSVTSSSQILINAPDLYGGDEREGGIQGYLDVQMGEPTQLANDYLTAVQGTPQSAFRGVFTAVLRRGLIAAMNPYVKAINFKFRRILKGWRTPVFYPAKALINMSGIHAMNPAHIVYQVLTDPEWGMGYPTGSIDAASFTSAADQLYSEGFGLCLLWTRQDTIEGFLQTVVDHIGAVLVTDRRTGLFQLKLIRGGYDPGTLPLFDESNVAELTSYQRAGEEGLTNEVIVKYRDPLTNQDAVSAPAHNLANITAQGGIVSLTVPYPGVPNGALADRLALRDLRARGTPLAKLSFKANRAAYKLTPGDVIRFSWAKLGISEVAFRIGAINYGDVRDGTITIEAAEDAFGLPAGSFNTQEPQGWQNVSNAPAAPAAVAMFEAPYREVYLVTDPGTLATYDASSCFVAGAAARPGSGLPLSFDFQTKVGAASFATRQNQGFAPYGLIASTVGKLATSVVLNSAKDLDKLKVGDVASLGLEVVRVDGISGTTITIARGCLDTVPADHSAGTAFMAFDRYAAGDVTEYAPGETVNGRFVTIAIGGRLADGSAPTASVTTNQRFGRPYPPADFKIGGNRYPTTVAAGAITFTWNHRDRLGQADQVFDYLAASTGPEAGTTYTLALYGDGGALRRTETGLTGTSYTWTTEAADSGGVENLSLRAVLKAVRGGLDSYQLYDHSFERGIVGGTTYARDWDDSDTSSQTRRTPVGSQDASSGKLVIDPLSPATLTMFSLDWIPNLANFDATFDLIVPASPTTMRVAYRTTNFGTNGHAAAYIVQINSAGSAIYVGDNSTDDVYTPLATGAGVGAGSTITVEIKVIGGAHIVKINGVVLFSVSNATFTGAGKFALGAYNGAVTFDNFSVTG